MNFMQELARATQKKPINEQYGMDWLSNLSRYRMAERRGRTAKGRERHVENYPSNMPEIADDMAMMGRGGDNMVAHMTKGEFNIPRKVLDENPNLLGAIAKAMTRSGLDWTEFVAGSPNMKRNPETGAGEFYVGEGTSGDAPGIDASISDTGASIGGAPGMEGISDPGQTGAPTGVSPAEGGGGIGGNISFSEQVNQAVPSLLGYSMYSKGAEQIGSSINALLGALGIEGSAPAVGSADPGGHGIGTLENLSPAQKETLEEVIKKYSRPVELAQPGFLGLGAGMTPLQLRSAIATYGTEGEDSAFDDPLTKSYYKNLLQRSLISDTGELGDYSQILPIEHRYLQQALGLNYQPTTQGLLDAIAAS
ncbi:MAG: hypothetical protein C4523_02460 [Myxococcales bacterium]|jgi:hypothetical protein|nr:MAG: hypothetical protein C4523_02460 [Myxococcales bacterium]